MQLIARLIQILPLQTGTGKNGEWKKQDIIVETDAQYPKKIYISVWGEKINENKFQIGNLLKIDFDIESREYNGRWYTDLKAWRIELGNTNMDSQPEPDINIDISAPEEDVLPF